MSSEKLWEADWNSRLWEGDESKVETCPISTPAAKMASSERREMAPRQLGTLQDAETDDHGRENVRKKDTPRKQKSDGEAGEKTTRL